MIRRLYINNFRCLSSFELPIEGQTSTLLIGSNGAGKSTVRRALELLQSIGRGTSRVKSLLDAEDFTVGHTDVPIRFEVTVEIDSKIFDYSIAFELPPDFRELRIFEERLTVSGEVLFDRRIEKLTHKPLGRKAPANLTVDWHLVALSVLGSTGERDSLAVFRKWLAQMLVIRPVPSAITGDSVQGTLQPCTDLNDLGSWFSGMIAQAPSSYALVHNYVKQLLPDLLEIRNPATGPNSRSMTVVFQTDQGTIDLPFSELSEGEKCYVLCGLVLAANTTYGPLFCFWDEPDAHLALSEVGNFVLSLRRSFLKTGGQMIATSHNPEAIEKFPEENILFLERRSHLEPTILRKLSTLETSGDLVATLIRGDVHG